MKVGTFFYLVAIAALVGWDVYASEYMIRVWGIASEGNPLMEWAVLDGWLTVLLVKLVGFIPLSILALYRAGGKVSVWGLRLTFYAHAALGYWHCWGLALATSL